MRRRRRINYKFRNTYLKPRGVPLSQLQQTNISFEELELLRLRYLEGKNQEESANEMNISQSQYQRDLTEVMRKITQALVYGDAICLEEEVLED